MAKQVITVLTDDLDGTDADRTVEFGLDGVSYTIDLSEKNVGKLRTALEPYLTVATRMGRTGGIGRIASRATPPAKGRTTRDQNQEIRQWANQNGTHVVRSRPYPGPDHRRLQRRSLTPDTSR